MVALSDPRARRDRRKTAKPLTTEQQAHADEVWRFAAEKLAWLRMKRNPRLSTAMESHLAKTIIYGIHRYRPEMGAERWAMSCIRLAWRDIRSGNARTGERCVRKIDRVTGSLEGMLFGPGRHDDNYDRFSRLSARPEVGRIEQAHRDVEVVMRVADEVLSPEHLETVRLVLAGHNLNEIGRMLGITGEAVRLRLLRACERLRMRARGAVEWN